MQNVNPGREVPVHEEPPDCLNEFPKGQSGFDLLNSTQKKSAIVSLRADSQSAWQSKFMRLLRTAMTEQKEQRSHRGWRAICSFLQIA